MTPKSLHERIFTLANLTETDDPVVSCYLNLESGYRPALNERVCFLKKGIARQRLQSFWEAVGQVEYFMLRNLFPESKSIAVFSRGGEQSFFVSLQFGIPFPTRVSAGYAPDIFSLVALNDLFRNFLVLFAAEGEIRLLEINADSVKNRSEIHVHKILERHAQRHERRTKSQNLTGPIELLAEAAARGGYQHWILAGDARITSKIAGAIPNLFVPKLVSTIRASNNDRNPVIAMAALAAFEEFETQSRMQAQARLEQEIKNRASVVSGTASSVKALRTERASALLMSNDYDPGRGWTCRVCRELAVALRKPTACPRCGASRLHELSIREEMVRMAVRNGCPVRILEAGEGIAAIGNVGCLLRHTSTRPCANSARGTGPDWRRQTGAPDKPLHGQPARYGDR